MLNTLSGISYKIMSLGLTAANYKPIYVPDKEFAELVRVMFSVPQKPENYDPEVEVKQEKEHIAVLTSGGLESTVAYVMAEKKLGFKPLAIYIDMGQKARRKEINAMEELGIYPKVIVKKPPNLSRSWNHIQPGRNLFYIAIAAEQLILGGEVWFGAYKEEISKDDGDKSEKFLYITQTLLNRYLPFKVNVKIPTSQLSKSDLIQWLLNEGWSENKIRRINSCYNDENKHCGHCPSCVERFLAFWKVGMDVSSDYEINPASKNGELAIKSYKQRLQDSLERKDFRWYRKDRCENDLAVIKSYEKIK